MPTDNALKPNGLRVPFGRRDGKLVAPFDVVETGLSCDCTCPGCVAQLMVRQGKKRRQFAHHDARGSERCVELSIHAAAMQVLLHARWLQVPAMAVTVKRYSRSGEAVVVPRELFPEKVVRFDACLPEVTITSPEWGTMRPDVVGYRNDKELLLEVCYTHAVDAEKLAKVRSYRRPTIEIYVGDISVEGGLHALEQQLLYGTYISLEPMKHSMNGCLRGRTIRLLRSSTRLTTSLMNFLALRGVKGQILYATKREIDRRFVEPPNTDIAGLTAIGFDPDASTGFQTVVCG
jgi:hypothetical protein